MEKIKTSANVVNNSNNVASVENLNEINVTDATTTKGKVSGKFNLNDQAAAEAATDKVDKNQLFSVEVADYFCPVKYDGSALESSLQTLVSSGLMSEEMKAKTMDAAKKEFISSHAAEIEAANKLSFAEVLAKLQERETLYKKVLAACCLTELKESDYITPDGKVMIYRGAQCLDKDGKERYQAATLTRNEGGKEFTQPLFVELRDQTTANILLSIRYYSNKQNAAKTLLNKVTDYRRMLDAVMAVAQKAKANGFSLEQVIAKVTLAYSED